MNESILSLRFVDQIFMLRPKFQAGLLREAGLRIMTFIIRTTDIFVFPGRFAYLKILVTSAQKSKKEMMPKKR